MRLALKRIAWYPKAFFATVGPVTQTFLETLGADADLTFSSSQWEQYGGLNPPGCCEFHESYVKAYKEEPSYHAATAYAAGQILKAAILKAGSVDREKLRNVLLGMDTMSIIGRYGVDRRGMQIKHFNLTIQWQKGKKEIVWPEELRTAKPLFR
jgi:branched-chain amino acid transport system substrate-binding protein